MREIKFRGKRLENREWMYGDLYHTNELTCICDWSIRPHTVENFAVDPATVGQFTGLYSANLDFIEHPNKEAFFGDIIRWVDTDGNTHINELSRNDEFVCVMIGRIPYLRLYESGYVQPSKLQFEIIGNIHDNPELLKTE